MICSNKQGDIWVSEGRKADITEMQKLFFKTRNVILLSGTFNWFTVYALTLRDLLFTTDEISKLTKPDIKSSELHKFSLKDVFSFNWWTIFGSINVKSKPLSRRASVWILVFPFSKIIGSIGRQVKSFENVTLWLLMVPYALFEWFEADFSIGKSIVSVLCKRVWRCFPQLAIFASISWFAVPDKVAIEEETKAMFV